MSTANDLPGFEVPLHRSLTEPISWRCAAHRGDRQRHAGRRRRAGTATVDSWRGALDRRPFAGRVERASIRSSCRFARHIKHKPPLDVGDAAMLNLAEYRQRPALLADWLPWAGLIAPGVVLNKDGSFSARPAFAAPT